MALKTGWRQAWSELRRTALVHPLFPLLRFGLGRPHEVGKFNLGVEFVASRYHHSSLAKTIVRFARLNHHGSMKNSEEFDQELYSRCYC